ncbi:tetratricopeptide repeat protein [Clostridium ganghwense]|uniref:Tetratricopeptide repeat protein n=1 Tax=Clostridium ganghwense TaxID=312089 RepID=A0ABT4CM16_9CLOT|nr:tetratricopeptide repeat protein [Clostridium ganghwense]MCY6369281.1 tetratricopeptide repeat protein [Clostridium ganghwense]
MNNKIKKIVIISMVIFIAIAGAVFGTYKYNMVQSYNNLINEANQYMDGGEYDKAIAVFNQSLSYKKDTNVERSITLAKRLKEVKVIYDNGIKQMSDKNYSEAIETFKKVTKEDSKIYDNAKKKIEECKKQFTALNIQKASNSAKNNKYEEANKYLDEVLKLDSNNAEVKKLKDAYDKKDKEEQDKIKAEQQEKQKEEAKKSSSGVTQQQACKIVERYVKHKGVKTIFEYDHDENRNGVNYYVIHAFDDMGDHIATSGWYYVDKKTGKAYEWDLVSDNFILLN